MALEISAEGVRLNRSENGPPLVGQTIRWAAEVSEPGTFRYRFRILAPGGDYRMIRDYGPIAWLDWRGDEEGWYELEVSVRNLNTGEVWTESRSIVLESRTAGDAPVVSATEHPLVFLFSAPACPSGARMRVRFEPVAGGQPKYTPFRDCSAGTSMNFYLAGLYAETAYLANAELDSGEASSPVQFETGLLPAMEFSHQVLKAAPAGTAQNVLLATTAEGQIATDLDGRVLWFNPSPQTYATSVDPGGFIWGFIENFDRPIEEQAIRKVDLQGRTVLETNAWRVNEQLAAMGKRQISGFHHEVRTLSDGRIVALAVVEQLLTDVQGPGTLDVLGDMIIVFDGDLQVVWTWDAFDHLDVTRKATMGEVCPLGGGGCPPFYLAPTANDWTHGNAVHETPDGHLIFSARHQDWLIKIDYAGGAGDGHVIWRLGKDGDFSLAGRDPSAWFSHQHDGNFESSNRLLVFDNGNMRVRAANGAGNSAGQVLELDEQNRVATLVLNADLGVFAPAVGSAQRLQNGNYHFLAGFVPAPGGLTAYSLEINRSGVVVSSVKADTLVYRSFRMMDLYTPN
jgi:hypothetical protein